MQEQQNLLRQKKRKRGMKNVVTEEIASALDRSQVSDRKSMFVLAAAASSLGHDVQKLTLNRSSIRRARISIRSQTAELIKESFSPDLSLTVQWDGKLLPDVTGNQKVDRLTILVSGANKVKLLGVPKIPSGTGKCMAKAIVECLEDWGIKDRIKAMSFDTTASNTGSKVGSCTLIEQMLDRNLLYLTCHHHILEIIAENVFATCHKGASTGPDIKFFQRFKAQWNFINREQFEIGSNNFPGCTEIIEFCQHHLQSAQPHDDYQELLELTIIYLGGIPLRGIHFRQPGALHSARWMAHIIYAIKICLFQSQFEMSRSEKESMKHFADFSVTTYVKYWILAPSAAAAPSNDLIFLKKLVLYPEKSISEAALKSFARHQWYLSETLVSLSFFDDEVDFGVKRDMIKALKIKGTPSPLKRISIEEQLADQSALMQKTVANYVSGSSLHFFKSLNLSTDFLKADPMDWADRDDYQAAKKLVLSMKVVNDTSERAIALMTAFNSILTKNEDQKQYLLQVVEEHQRKFPNAKKETVTVGLNIQ